MKKESFYLLLEQKIKEKVISGGTPSKQAAAKAAMADFGADDDGDDD